MCEICPKCIKLCHVTLRMLTCSYCPMKMNLTLAQFPGGLGTKPCFWWGACPLLPACENKLARDIELQRELEGLSKFVHISMWVWASWSTHNMCDSIVLASVEKWRTKYLETTPLGNMQSPQSIAVGTWTPIFSSPITMETLCVLLHIFSQAGTLAVSVCVCLIVHCKI